MHFSGGNDEVFGGVVLQDEPHALDVVFGISPVASGIQIAQIQLVLEALGDAGSRQCDFLVTKVSPRRSLSWLKSMPFTANMP